MARKASPPTYRKQKTKSSDRAFVVLSGVRKYLGLYGSAESREAYGRLVAEWEASGGNLPVSEREVVITEVIARYWQYAESYYVRNGRPTSEVQSIRQTSRWVEGVCLAIDTCDGVQLCRERLVNPIQPLAPTVCGVGVLQPP